MLTKKNSNNNFVNSHPFMMTRRKGSKGGKVDGGNIRGRMSGGKKRERIRRRKELEVDERSDNEHL